DHAPGWAAYPLRIKPHQPACVWIDLHVPENAEEGLYSARIIVRDRDDVIARLPLRLEVKGAQLPFKAVKTAVLFVPAMLGARVGKGPTELRLWQLFHRHHLTPMLSAKTVADIHRLRPAIDGKAFRHEHGYTGPGRT